MNEMVHVQDNYGREKFFFYDDYSFCLQMDGICQESEDDSSEGVLPSQSGLDPDYNPTAASLFCDEDLDEKSPNKASTCEKLSSEEDLKDPDTDSGDEGQQRQRQVVHKKTQEHHYLPCTYCNGMFSEKDLWRHHSTCRSKKSCVTRRVQSQAAHLLPIVASSSGCQNIFLIT